MQGAGSGIDKSLGDGVGTINMLGRYSFHLPDLPGCLRPQLAPETPEIG
ncbi:hypothetical protein ACWCQS_40785 [Streptomyces sp. NPDC002076]